MKFKIGDRIIVMRGNFNQHHERGTVIEIKHTSDKQEYVVFKKDLPPVRGVSEESSDYISNLDIVKKI